MITLNVILHEVTPQRAARRLAANLCRSGRPKKVAGVRWVTAPQSSLPGAPAVQGVTLAANEDVQWSWTHTANGSYVSGYNIVGRLTSPRVILSEVKPLRADGRVTANLSCTGRPKKRQRPFVALRVTIKSGGGL